MFQVNQRFREAVAIANAVDAGKFPRVVNHIAAAVLNHVDGSQNAAVFTPSEKTKFESVFGLSRTAVDTLTEFCSYVLLQAGYYGADAGKLSTHLLAAGMSDAHVAAFTECWTELGKAITKRLQEASIGAPLTLEEMRWQMQLELGSKDLQKEQVPKAVLNLGLRPASNGKTLPLEYTTTELSYEQLLDMYDKLERIQAQLDSLQ